MPTWNHGFGAYLWDTPSCFLPGPHRAARDSLAAPLADRRCRRRVSALALGVLAHRMGIAEADPANMRSSAGLVQP